MNRVRPHVIRPSPPSCIRAFELCETSSHTKVSVGGLVIVRQKPMTAKGTIFLTLEDETGFANIIVWKNTFEKYRQEVTSARLLRVTGTVQNEQNVVHVIANKIEDLSHWLDTLALGEA